MKRIAFIALLALTIPAHATNISEGEWVGPHGIRLFFDGYNFKKWAGLPGLVDCRITDWPISSPVAQAECEDGQHHTVEIRGENVIFDGETFFQNFEHQSDGSDGH